MRYHPDDFLRLEEVIEQQGGTRASGKCTPKKFSLKVPDAEGKVRSREYYTGGCGKESLFIVPYRKPSSRDEKGATIEGGTGTLVVCAVDDSLGRWPRFRDVIEEDSY